MRYTFAVVVTVANDEWTEGKDDLSRVAGSSKYFGGVLLPDDRVVFVPSNANRVGLYDPIADKWTEGKDDLSSVGSVKYKGGVLLPNSVVLMVPYYANHVGLYDSLTDSWRYHTTRTMWACTTRAKKLVVSNTPAWTQGKDNVSATQVARGHYIGGVLLPDGRVVLVPSNANRVGLYDAGGTRAGSAYSVSNIAQGENALLLPYYNKL